MFNNKTGELHTFFIYIRMLFQAQAEYSNFSTDFRLKILVLFLDHSL